MAEQRALSTIAAEISGDWRTPSPAAVPYIRAMMFLDSMTDRYLLDDAEDIVMRFLINAHGWRGDVARRVKAELNAMLRDHRSM